MVRVLPENATSLTPSLEDASEVIVGKLSSLLQVFPESALLYRPPPNTPENILLPLPEHATGPNHVYRLGPAYEFQVAPPLALLKMKPSSTPATSVVPSLEIATEVQYLSR